LAYNGALGAEDRLFTNLGFLEEGNDLHGVFYDFWQME